MMVRVVWVAVEQVIKLQDRGQQQSAEWCDHGIEDSAESWLGRGSNTSIEHQAAVFPEQDQAKMSTVDMAEV